MPGASGNSRSGAALNETIFNDLQVWGSRDPEALDMLYNSPFAVHCVFRALPPLARLYTFRLLYLSKDAPALGVDTFAACLRRRQRALDRHDLAIRALKALRVLLIPQNGGMLLNEPFASKLRLFLAGQLTLPFGGPQLEHVDAARVQGD
eukprot:IDg10988t1